MDQFNTPVLLLIFNRPENTAKVLEAISAIKPTCLYVAADGPRIGNSADIELCAETRKLVEESITWPAEIKTLFRDENLGCGKGVSIAITWFFSQVTEGIILEDDCVPNTSFFMYCRELLDHYKTDDRVMHIGGTNFQPPDKNYAASYYFSSIAHVWGWATWKRAWDKYSFEIEDLPAFIASDQIGKYHDDPTIVEYWYDIFRRMERHEIDTWDHQWIYAIWKNSGLTIIPAVNMISNIGYGADATHTKEAGNWSDIPTKGLVDIQHPDKIVQGRPADVYTFYQHYADAAPVIQPPSLWERFKRPIRPIFKHIKSAILTRIENFLSRHSSLYSRPRSLLFLKVDSIGDYILVRNFIECFRQSEKYKEYSITLCGNELCKDLVQRLDAKHIDRFIWINYYRMYRDRDYRIKKYLQIYFSGFRVLVHPTSSRCIVSDGIVMHSGAKDTIGFDGDYSNLPEATIKFNNKWYTQLITVPAEAKFEFEKNKEFFKRLLGNITILKPFILFTKPVEEYVVICPGAKFEFRRWSPGNFATLCDLVGSSFGGKFIIAGSSEDIPLADEIKRRSHQQFEDLTGKKNLSELIDIFAKARLIITNDSGPLHIAFAMNKNVIGISNGHHYQRFTPYPSYMNMNGTCIYPKQIKELASVSTRIDLLPDINVIQPEEVYAIIMKQYLPKHEAVIDNNY